MVALFGALLACAAPCLALAESGQVKLALRPVGQAGSYFDLTMHPGEIRTLMVDIANTGDAALAVRTYAADVYTIVNGGFGGHLRDEPRTGTTRWLGYATDVVEVPAGEVIRRSFTVAVPADAGPGEYIASIVLENDQPIRGAGAVALDQVLRQAVAVVVTVPGRRSPGLAIGAASHKVVAERSIVSIAVDNTGNVRLKPVVGFTLFDASGAQVSQASLQMDTFYAHTDTFVEVPLAALLLPGTYTVRLTLVDSAQGARADKEAITFVVDAPAERAGPAGAVPALTAVNQAPGDGRISLPVGAIEVAAAVTLSGVLAGVLFLARRRRREGIQKR